MLSQVVEVQTEMPDEEIARRLEHASESRDSRGFFGQLAGEAPAKPFLGKISAGKASLHRAVHTGSPQNDNRLWLRWNNGYLQVTQKSPLGIRAIWVLAFGVVALTVIADLMAREWIEPVIYILVSGVAFALQRVTFHKACQANLELIREILEKAEPDHEEEQHDEAVDQPEGTGV